MNVLEMLFPFLLEDEVVVQVDGTGQVLVLFRVDRLDISQILTQFLSKKYSNSIAKRENLNALIL